MTLKSWLTLAASAAINGALGFLATQFGNGLPSTAQAWTAALVGTVFGALVAVVHLYQTSPPDLTKMRALASAAGKTLVVGFLVLTGAGAVETLEGCSSVKSAVDEFNAVEQKVVADLEAGDTDVQIVNDVETLLGANATVIMASDLVLDVVNGLLASGILAKHEPANVVANASAVQASLTPKVAALHNPPLPAGR